jgi:hypothetical protein
MLALHEPFGDIVYDGETDIDGITVSSGRDAIAAIRTLAKTRVVFIKECTDHWHRDAFADEEFLAEATHTFLIRHPASIASSFYALDKSMRRKDIGLEFAYDLYLLVRNARRGNPVVIDSEDLVSTPAGTIAAYCSAIGLPFIPEALSWNSGLLPEWRRVRWHVDVSNSSGFESIVHEYAATPANHPMLSAFCAYHMPFYQRLQNERLSIPRA